MADNTQMVSYDLEGKKLSFANWISNLSPQDTPFVTMTGKEAINQTLFQWQTDSLAAAVEDNAVIEGSQAVSVKRESTTKLSNITQILRKVVKVSDTANVLANYGRGRELQYQMEKAGKEIKRDLEMSFLHNGEQSEETVTKGRTTAGFSGLVAALDAEDDDTGAKVHFSIAGSELAESDVWDMTYNLYLSGACANIIMFHPSHASFFSSLMEIGTGKRVRMFDGVKDTRVNTYVTEIVDPLGCAYKLIPNRWMPTDSIYFFNSKDWTQMVLRAPERVKLAKDGSYEKWMIEMEVGLRHRNPFASGILELTPASIPVDSVTIAPTTLSFDLITGGTKTGTVTATVLPANATDKKVTYKSSDTSVASVTAAGKVTGLKVGTANITATAGGKTSTACVVTVVDTTVPPESKTTTK